MSNYLLKTLNSSAHPQPLQIRLNLHHLPLHLPIHPRHLAQRLLLLTHIIVVMITCTPPLILSPIPFISLLPMHHHHDPKLRQLRLPHPNRIRHPHPRTAQMPLVARERAPCLRRIPRSRGVPSEGLRRQAPSLGVEGGHLGP